MSSTVKYWLRLSFWVAPVLLGTHPGLADTNGAAPPLKEVGPAEAADTLAATGEVTYEVVWGDNLWGHRI